MKKILIQGAMEIETGFLIEQIKKMADYQCLEENGMVFHVGTDGYKKYIVNTTGMGTVNAAMATACALTMLHPTVVVNQGTAGAQNRELSTGDVVLAEEAVNINRLKMPKKKMGEGSDPFCWETGEPSCFQADPVLLELYGRCEYTGGHIVRGRVGTGDIYSREDDRIVWLAEKFGTVCEDMESAAAYQVCQNFETPCVGLRIISNNELLDEEFNEETAVILQQYVWKVTHEYL